MNKFMSVVSICWSWLVECLMIRPRIKVGDVVIYIEDSLRESWVKVQNLEGQPNDNTLHSYGDEVWIKEGGRLTVVSDKGSHVLVEYESPTSRCNVGTAAGNGTHFLFSKTDIQTLVSRQEAVARHRGIEKYLKYK